MLPLGDAISDGAGIARHLEVLAEGCGQLSRCRLGQIKDAAVNLADLLWGEGSEARLTVRRCRVTIGVSRGNRLFRRRIYGLLIGASLLGNVFVRLVVRLQLL